MAQSKAFDSNAGSWPKFSGFRPLTPKSKEIRLLRLEKCGIDGEFQYSMYHADFTATPFAALSYSWGAPVPDTALRYIVIDGQSVFVRPILHAFLVTLAAHDRSVSLWIDAVCINQNDTDERNSQIAMMGEIFGSAQKVFVWLGPGDDDTNYAFEHIRASTPQTSFDQRQFQPAVEKIFRSSYWTRRWVIQEFALAQDLYIACGPYMTTWNRVMDMVDHTALENDDRALQVMENFKGLKALSARQDLGLLDLMLRFQASRCIDRRDKAFALRGIANDGFLLRPDYKESVADVYFRTLSLLPTEGVLPKMTGYRWPHRAASQLLNCFLVNRSDFLGSLEDKSSDRLFTVFEHVGEIHAIEQSSEKNSFWLCPKKVQLFGEPTVTLSGSDGLKPGDLVYSLQSSPWSPQGIYIAFRPDQRHSTITGMLLDDSIYRSSAERLEKHLELVWQIGPGGIVRCSRNSNAQSQKPRTLCHVSRSMMILLWLIERAEEEDLLRDREIWADVHRNSVGLCHCRDGTDTVLDVKGSKGDDQPVHLEILPAFHSHLAQDDLWDASKSPLWLTMTDERQTVSLQSQDSTQPSDELANRRLSFSRKGRNDLSYAAEDGLELWTRYIVQKNPSEVESQDFENNTPLWWAVSSGNLNVVKILLEMSQGGHDLEGAKGVTPLVRAIRADQSEVVKLMVDSEKVNITSWKTMGRTPLSWAAQAGHSGPVKALLTSNRVDPDAEDADGKTPLLWATSFNHGAIVELLLATKKININRKDLAGRTALSFAAERGNLRAVELLLEMNGIDPDSMDNQRWSPLRYAAKGRHTKVFKRLVATKKVKLNVPYEHYQAEDN